MGSGASNLSSEEIAALTVKLKGKFEDLKTSGVSDVEFGIQLMKEFNSISSELKKEPVSPKISLVVPSKLEVSSPTATSPLKSALNSRASFGVTSPGQAKHPHYASSIVRRSIDLSVVKVPTKPGRRRSFAQVGPAKTRRRSISSNITAVAPAEASVPVVEPMVESKAPDEPTTPPPPMDSWESVTEQLVCQTCKMTFKTSAIMSRHMKYSDIHQKNVAKAGGVGGQLTASMKGTLAREQSKVHHLASPSEQKEGVDYLLYYHGNKFYWRDQKSVDFDIYLHVLPHVFEVIALDTEKYKDLNRLYLDSVSVEQIIEPKLKETVDARLEKDRFGNVEAIREEHRRNYTITAILERLQLHTDINDAGSYVTSVIFVQQMSDKGPNACLEAPPRVLIPITLARTRKRHSTTGEIHSFLQDLDTNRAEMTQYLKKASELLGMPTEAQTLLLATSSTSATAQYVAADKTAKRVHEFIQYLLAKKWWSALTGWRLKWVKAIRLVIRRRLVGLTKAKLQKARFMMAKSILRRAPSTRAKEL